VYVEKIAPKLRNGMYRNREDLTSIKYIGGFRAKEIKEITRARTVTEFKEFIHRSRWTIDMFLAQKLNITDISHRMCAVLDLYGYAAMREGVTAPVGLGGSLTVVDYYVRYRYTTDEKPPVNKHTYQAGLLALCVIRDEAKKASV
jgi:hypothetical protein